MLQKIGCSKNCPSRSLECFCPLFLLVNAAALFLKAPSLETFVLFGSWTMLSWLTSGWIVVASKPSFFFSVFLCFRDCTYWSRVFCISSGRFRVSHSHPYLSRIVQDQPAYCSLLFADGMSRAGPAMATTSTSGGNFNSHTYGIDRSGCVCVVRRPIFRFEFGFFWDFQCFPPCPCFPSEYFR